MSGSFDPIMPKRPAMVVTSSVMEKAPAMQPTKPKPLSEYYEQGTEARQSGQSLGDNPYDDGSARHREWDAGFRDTVDRSRIAGLRMRCIVLLVDDSQPNLFDDIASAAYTYYYSSSVEDLLDKLWYYGSEIAYIFIGYHPSLQLDEFYTTMMDWPDIRAFVFNCDDKPIGAGSNVIFLQNHSSSLRALHREDYGR